MSFDRQASTRWHEEVPGSRWLKSDLHVHTIDDLPGGRAKMPAGIDGDPTNPNVLREYARVFLKGAVRAGVQVLGLTPHATRVGDGPETSAVWQIIDVWNREDDEDGEPFRDKIYAIYPGFEPNVKDGGSGVHLLFLFDPEIGRKGYLALFEAVMDGRSPWDAGTLKLTSRGAEEVLLEVFDDRAVITSPGRLPNAITTESVRAGGHPRSRNEQLANYMAAMGMMEQRVRGWPVISRAMWEHNGTEPELQEDRAGSFVRVTLRLRSPAKNGETTNSTRT